MLANWKADFEASRLKGKVIEVTGFWKTRHGVEFPPERGCLLAKFRIMPPKNSQILNEVKFHIKKYCP